jgi:hypothetical protein
VADLAPPARTKATCSVTTGAQSSRASAPRRRARSGSIPSALPSESFTPCGTTGQTRETATASRCAAGLAKHASATTSTKSTQPGARKRSAAISDRKPMPAEAAGRGREEGMGRAYPRPGAAGAQDGAPSGIIPARGSS